MISSLATLACLLICGRIFADDGSLLGSHFGAFVFIAAVSWLITVGHYYFESKEKTDD
jgi:hypothetical protein